MDSNMLTVPGVLSLSIIVSMFCYSYWLHLFFLLSFVPAKILSSRSDIGSFTTA